MKVLAEKEDDPLAVCGGSDGLPYSVFFVEFQNILNGFDYIFLDSKIVE